MASKYELTGGTKDVNPQYLNCTVTATVKDKTHHAEVALPVQRLNNRNRSMVMEILKVQWVSQSADGAHRIFCGLSTNRLSEITGTIPQLTNPSIAVFFQTSGTAQKELGDVIQDYTDSAGHGVLIGADKLYLFAYSGDTDNIPMNCRIWYRWKNVSLTEYIGIVQASQL